MPPAIVAAPPLTPARNGLVVSGRDASAEGERWGGGFGWEPESCASAAVLDPCDNGAEDKAILDTDLEDAQTFTPFHVWVGYRCRSMPGAMAEREAKVRRLLAAHESRAIEAEFYLGTESKAEGWDNNYLANPDSVTVLSTGSIDNSSPLLYGLMELEDAIADAGVRGMIHATTRTASLWYSNQALRREGNLLLTGLDTIVVAGAGYDGTGPVGQASEVNEHPWAYATGLVDVRRGPVEILGNDVEMDRRQNLWEIRAERLAAATFDPCLHVGVRVDLCETFCVPVGS